MPNMDGTGPRQMGRRSGFGFGRCYGAGRIGRNGGRRMGFCRFAATDDKETMMVLKTILEQRLACVKARLQKS